MNFRATIAALVLLVIVAAVFIYTWTNQPHRHHQASVTQAFARPLPALRKITIKRRGKRPVVFTRKGRHWQIIAPLHTQARQYRLSGLATDLRTIHYRKKMKVRSSGAHSLKAMGLAAPSATAVIVDAKGHSHTLAIGRRRAAGGVYARVTPGPAVAYVLGSTWRQRLSRRLASYRSKHLASLHISRVQGLAITRGPRTIVLKKTGKRWMIEQPIATRANNAAVQHILNTFQSLQAQGFAQVSRGDAGLTPPAIAVTLLEKPAAPPVTAKGKKPQPQPLKKITMDFGEYVDLRKQAVYAARAGDPSVFTVGADVYKAVDQRLLTLRDSAVLPAPVANATAVDLVRHRNVTALRPAHIALKKIAGRWKLQLFAPAASTTAASAKAVQGLLHAMALLHANKFVDAAGNLAKIGLVPPARVLRFTIPGRSRAQSIEVGNPQKAQPLTPVKRQGQSTVMLVQTPDLKGLNPTILQLRSRKAASFQAEQISSIHIAATGRPAVTLRHAGKVWMLIAGSGKAQKVRATPMTLLLGDFDPLRAVRYTAIAPPAGKPAMAVRLTVHRTAHASRKQAGPQPQVVLHPVLAIFATQKKGAAPAYQATLQGASKHSTSPTWTFQPDAQLMQYLLHPRQQLLPKAHPAAKKPPVKPTK